MDNSIEIGPVRKDGGPMNYSTPILLENGRKIALACGKDIKILNSLDCRHVSNLEFHQHKVVGMAMQKNKIISCDEKGYMFRWILHPDLTVDCKVLSQFPIPPLGAVEHVAHLGQNNNSLALVVDLNKGLGPKALLLQRNYYQIYKAKFNILLCDLIGGNNSVAFSRVLPFCVALSCTTSQHAINIIPIGLSGGKLKNNRILTGLKTPTCICVHPHTDDVAVGDTFGGIEIYHKVMYNTYPGSRRVHWHSTPVLDICFSITGNELYSGASEGVLVQWNLAGATKEDKNFIPRFGQPITHIALSDGGNTLVASHSDNTFSICDMLSLQLVSVILGHGLSRCPSKLATNSRSLRSRPLLKYDSRTEAVITNAKAGYLHFYHISTQQQLFLVDLIHENYVQTVSNTRDVTHVDLSTDGLRLVSLDAIHDELSSQRLKFWRFDLSTKTWMLECSVLDPHCGEAVLGCLLQPTPTTDTPLGLTWTAEQIKLWAAHTDMQENITRWTYVDAISLPDLCRHETEPNRGDVLACWSQCGTEVAVTNGATRVSVWQVGDYYLANSCILSNKQLLPAAVTDMHFSPTGHAVVVLCADGNVGGYCQLTRRVLYAHNLDGAVMQTSVQARIMALGTNKGEVLLFRGHDGEVVASIDTKESSAPLAMLLCPMPSLCPLVALRLLCYTTDMDVLSVVVSLCSEQLPLSSIEVSEEFEEETQSSSIAVFMAETKQQIKQDDPLFIFKSYGKTPYITADFFVKNEAFIGLSHQQSSFATLVTGVGEMLLQAAEHKQS